jgi:hypothetical protein
MTEEEWLACADPAAMLEFLRGKASDRKLRFFASACCRLVWHLLIDQRSRVAVEAAELYADGRLSDSDAQMAFSSACRASLDVRRADALPATALRLRRHDDPDKLWRASFMAAFAVGTGVGDVQAHIKGANANLVDEVTRTRLLHDLFGPLPVRPIRVDSRWLTPTVVNLAGTIYVDRAFDLLPDLGVALCDAGCDNADILEHCRQPGPHIPGCWAVDLLLGKE